MVQQDKKGRRGKKIDRNSGSFRLVPNNEYEQDEVSGISCQDKCPSVQGGSRIVSQSSDRQGHIFRMRRKNARTSVFFAYSYEALLSGILFGCAVQCQSMLKKCRFSAQPKLHFYRSRISGDNAENGYYICAHRLAVFGSLQKCRR